MSDDWIFAKGGPLDGSNDLVMASDTQLLKQIECACSQMAEFLASTMNEQDREKLFGICREQACDMFCTAMQCQRDLKILIARALAIAN